MINDQSNWFERNGAFTYDDNKGDSVDVDNSQNSLNRFGAAGSAAFQRAASAGVQ